jgi:hypothetical protein
MVVEVDGQVCVEVMMMAVRLGFMWCGTRRLQDHSCQAYCDTSQDVHGACKSNGKCFVPCSRMFRA